MLREGDAIGVYQLDELVGRGVTGVMFRGRTRLGRTVALRIVDPELASDPIVRTRLNRESTVLAQLDHPNVVPLYEAAEIDDRLCLSSRWVNGRSLAHLIRCDGPLEVRRAVRIIGQIAAALQAAHDLEVIHRDVKPSNVLVTRGDHAYLTDFCLARRSTDTAGLTVPNELLATVDYVAPEAISGGTVDHRADIYGLGLVLFEALVGEVPFPRKVEAAKVYAHLSVPPPSIHERRPEVPRALDAVVQRALAKEPGDRQESAAAFARAAFEAVDLTGPGIAAAAPDDDATAPDAPAPAASAPARRPPFGPPDDGEAKNVRAQSRRARRAAAAVDAAAHDAPPRAGGAGAGAGRYTRRVLAGVLILAFLAGPSLLVLALEDEDAGPRAQAVGAAARGVAVAGGRVWVADGSGESLHTTTIDAPRRRTRLALDAGRIRGVASRGHRLLVATDEALVDIPRGDLGRAKRVRNTAPVGPLAVGGGSLWAATTAGKPELLRVEGDRLARIPLRARASARGRRPHPVDRQREFRDRLRRRHGDPGRPYREGARGREASRARRHGERGVGGPGGRQRRGATEPADRSPESASRPRARRPGGDRSRLAAGVGGAPRRRRGDTPGRAHGPPAGRGRRGTLPHRGRAQRRRDVGRRRGRPADAHPALRRDGPDVIAPPPQDLAGETRRCGRA
jgi:hypothetical protein